MYKKDEKILNSLMMEHVKSTSDKGIKLFIYYKSKPLSTLLKEKNVSDISQRSHVVYHYKCDQISCRADYVGYTCTSLEIRAKRHAYNGAIISHIRENHDATCKTINCKNFKILFTSNSKKSLQIAEALLIKKHNPILNRRQEGLTRRLYIL